MLGANQDDHRDRGLQEEIRQLPLCLFDPPMQLHLHLPCRRLLGDVAKDEDDARNNAVRIADRGGTVFDDEFSAAFGYEGRMVG